MKVRWLSINYCVTYAYVTQPIMSRFADWPKKYIGINSDIAINKLGFGRAQKEVIEVQNTTLQESRSSFTYFII